MELKIIKRIEGYKVTIDGKYNIYPDSIKEVIKIVREL